MREGEAPSPLFVSSACRVSLEAGRAQGDLLSIASRFSVSLQLANVC
jgi:hypothetical protein